ncbi:hypothetical protein C8J56DRAFT_1020261 [Mycena floridula]|nr:hypothetical protein C8J56DRAFT_1020261 [Mycena floridula]
MSVQLSVKLRPWMQHPWIPHHMAFVDLPWAPNFPPTLLWQPSDEVNTSQNLPDALNDELHDVDPFFSACMIGGNPAISWALLRILSATVFAYAYLLALEPENPVCLCFGMNIYAVALHVATMSPFVDTVALVSLTFGESTVSDLSPGTCRKLFIVKLCETIHRIFSSGFLTSEGFLTLRLWGSVQTESSVDDGVWSLGGDLLDTRNCNVGAFDQFNDMFILLFEQDIVSDSRLCVQLFEGCFVKEGNHIMLVAWILNTISSPDKTDTQSILLETICQDVFVTANSLFIVALPYDISILLLTLHRVVHSVLTTRTVLHIPEAALLDQLDNRRR